MRTDAEQELAGAFADTMTTVHGVLAVHSESRRGALDSGRAESDGDGAFPGCNGDVRLTVETVGLLLLSMLPILFLYCIRSNLLYLHA